MQDLKKNVLVSGYLDDRDYSLVDMYKAINGGNHLGKNGTNEKLELKTKFRYKDKIKK